MKKYILVFAASSMMFSSVVSCKEGEDSEQEVIETESIDEFEQTQQDMSAESNELEDTQLVPSGTYTGEAVVVDTQQNEIYVRLNDNTKIENFIFLKTLR